MGQRKRKMKHRRFRIRKESIQGREAVIEDRSEIRHISKVLRLGIGDRVTLFDGEGKEYPACIERLSSDEVSFTLIEEPTLTPKESSLRIILGVALLKSSKFEWLLQKITELGVSEILPLYSRHVVPRWEGGQIRTRVDRWEKIVSEAAKQCGRAKIPKIHEPRSFEETLAIEFDEATKIFLWEREETKNLKDALATFSSVVFVLVGPEGGFSEDEAIRAQEAGFRPVRLGPRILRAETAGIVIVSLLQFLFGDLK